ncbi:alpha-ketoglutarate-dependent dioxygenase AlkB family protein [Pedobacter sandarakinus]|uniref:alpha-ketoglutarate-dependent dioxygenase AlkB family protein n=1 Tax=Pedobacter sandarakinus TaxID=353156 RepID=UPI002246E022|nr:alpha-ketoglutarate-dependent dioxygenase AlkB [Pedobacter sandarakinus]MCX2575543.1 alpha-ketoglutarate-dependent dioxygenase AlkB [Pedobacter sandarakinus]
MNLFSTHINQDKNLLPYDGTVKYFGSLYTVAEANACFQNLLSSIEWKNDEAFIMGKHIITKRKVAWYGEENFPYTYSKATKFALPFTNHLLLLKQIAEKHTGASYNSCLLNLYHNGDEGMAYHSDDEKSLAPNSSIASMSFGEERKFLFKHKTTKETVGLYLENGSLLEMKDATQTFWLHRLPPTKKIKGARINLTFRTMLS